MILISVDRELHFPVKPRFFGDKGRTETFFREVLRFEKTILKSLRKHLYESNLKVFLLGLYKRQKFI